MTDDEIVTAYQLSGLGIKALARQYEISHHRVQRALRSRNASRPALPQHNLPHDAVVEAYRGGLFAREIASAYGCSVSAINVILRRYSAMRGKSASQSMRFGRMTDVERSQHMAPAQQAAAVTNRGRIHTEHEAEAIALGHEGKFRSDKERVVFDALVAAGFVVVPNKAVSRYNLDVALIDNMIGIEIDGGGWHSMRRDDDAVRDRFLVARGWRIVRYFKRCAEHLDLCVADVLWLASADDAWAGTSRIVRSRITQLRAVP